MSATLGDVAFFAEDLTRRNGRPTAVVKSGERPVPLEYAYSEIPLAQTLEKLVVGGQGARLRGPLHPEGRRGQRPGLHEPQPLHPRGEERGRRRAIAGFRFTSPYGPDIRKWLKQGIGAPPRGPPAQVPRARRAARAGGPAQGHLRHRHPRGRHQRPDPDGALLAPVQVRRAEDGGPLRARLPPDRGAGGAQGLRRHRLRRGPGPGARDREPPARREGEGREEGRQAEAARAQLRELGPADVQAAHGRAPGAAHLALPGLPRDAAQRPLPPRRRLPGDAAAHPRQPRAGPGEEGALRAGLAALPRARGIAASSRSIPQDRGGREAPGQRRPAGRLLDGPGALALPPRDASPARPRLGDLRPRPPDPGRERSSRTPSSSCAGSSTR